jgi:hypothetical protein
MNVFVIKIRERFFYEYKNNRINTSWCLAGAKLFSPFCSSELEKLEKVLNEKKIKFEKVFIQVVDEPKTEIVKTEDDFEAKPFQIPNDGKKREKVILRFTLPRVTSKSLIEILCVRGYRETGNKFSISFNGSKGYLSNFEISCEGRQKAENRIFVENLLNKDGTLKSIMINVFHSDENGVRLSTGNDGPQILEELPEKINEPVSVADDCDLPF